MPRRPVIFGNGGQGEAGNDIDQLRAVLRGISPLVWRRLLVRADSSVADFHEVLQVAFGWGDMHLNRFEIRDQEFDDLSGVRRGQMRSASGGLRRPVRVHG